MDSHTIELVILFEPKYSGRLVLDTTLERVSITPFRSPAVPLRKRQQNYHHQALWRLLHQGEDHTPSAWIDMKQESRERSSITTIHFSMFALAAASWNFVRFSETDTTIFPLDFWNWEVSLLCSVYAALQLETTPPDRSGPGWSLNIRQGKNHNVIFTKTHLLQKEICKWFREVHCRSVQLKSNHSKAGLRPHKQKAEPTGLLEAGASMFLAWFLPCT